MIEFSAQESIDPLNNPICSRDFRHLDGGAESLVVESKIFVRLEEVFDIRTHNTGERVHFQHGVLGDQSITDSIVDSLARGGPIKQDNDRQLVSQERDKRGDICRAGGWQKTNTLGNGSSAKRTQMAGKYHQVDDIGHALD